MLLVNLLFLDFRGFDWIFPLSVVVDVHVLNQIVAHIREQAEVVLSNVLGTSSAHHLLLLALTPLTLH